VLGLIVTLISLTICAAVQQSYRANANDPQIEAVRQITDVLSKGAPPEAIIGDNADVDLSNSMSLFVIIFDKDGKALVSNARLNDQIPTPPPGIFDTVREKGEYRVTWELEKDVRIASVIQKAGDDKGFVLAGRSLKEVDSRVDDLSKITLVSWLILLALSALLAKMLSSMASNNLTIVEENIVEVAEKPE